MPDQIQLDVSKLLGFRICDRCDEEHAGLQGASGIAAPGAQVGDIKPITAPGAKLGGKVGQPKIGNVVIGSKIGGKAGIVKPGSTGSSHRSAARVGFIKD